MRDLSAVSRRRFIRAAAATSVAVSWLRPGFTNRALGGEAAKPALLGGTPVHKGGWARWPEWKEAWEPELLKVWRSGRWFRGSGGKVEDFEKGYATLIGAKRCLATASGTTALMVSLHALDVGPGDEVLVSPYT
ncbi:MAG TPA: DegT/DnrJ/EryC1/StrS family aminotransferase, partial [Verrucomicrobiae bacterium]|nr:DegT/DnrJ/EryC1/StrS family aminotransferase [Verrucomicrobiae bacterium]